MHRIRLSAAWLLEWSSGSDQFAPQRVHLPCSEPLDVAAPGTLTLSRRFHRPSGLSPASQVHLRVEADRVPEVAVLNDEAILPAASPGTPPAADANAGTEAGGQICYDVSGGLNPFNTLSLRFGCENGADVIVPVRGAWLEITEHDDAR